MSTLNDMLAAFPQPSVKWKNPDGSECVAIGQQGMTLRDWFAGQALAGLCAAHANPSAIGYPDNDETAKKAYGLADAMLKARENKE